MNDTTDRTRETRLRRMAERQGLVLTKSRRRDPRALGYGEYCITDPDTNVRLAGYSHSLPDLDAVEYWLTTRRARTKYSVEIDAPERHEIAGMASPSDLAYPLAHALVIIEKYGLPRPRLTPRAETDGHVRDLAVDERESFDMAVEQALEKIRPEREDH